MPEKEKNLRFITARNDRIFKAVFVNDNNYYLLEELLKTCLGKEVKVEKILKTELSVKTNEERVKRLDLIVESEGKKINLELNTTYSEAIRGRNFNYFTAFYSEQTTIGNKYDITTEYIHIDLSYNMSKKEPEENEYTIYSEKTKDRYVDNFKILVFNMDRIKGFWYDKNEKGIEKYSSLIMLDLLPKELNDLEQESRNEVIKEYKKRVMKINEELDFIPPVSAEDDYYYLINTEKDASFRDGRKSEKLEIAKKLLKEGLNIELISRTTGLTKEEIEKINNDK